jgi:hypothetical protein
MAPFGAGVAGWDWLGQYSATILILCPAIDGSLPISVVISN